MKHLSTTVAIAVLGLALSRQAHAATLFTSPVQGDAVSNTLYCDVVNTRKTPLAITIEIYDVYGSLQTSLTNGAVQSGHGISTGHPFGGYCKFKVAGSKSSVAAMAIYSDNATHYYTTVELAR